MAGSYRQCDACGKRALSIANRCPGCGRDLPREVLRGGGLERGRSLTPKVVAAVAVVAVLVSANVALTGQPTEAKAGEESSRAGTALWDTASVAALPTGQLREEKPEVETATVAPPPAERGSDLRVARSWTDVRKSRSESAPLEAVLTPGDTVLADSLEQGWYRVALAGEVLGYAHRSELLDPGAAATSSLRR